MHINLNYKIYRLLLVIKRKELFINETTRISHKSIMISGRSKTQTATQQFDSTYKTFQKKLKLQGQKSEQAARSWERERNEL